MEENRNSGYKLWVEKLGSPRYILAPMVDQSELAWRMFSRKYGAELCYTPMIHATVFVKDSRYRKEALLTCSDDRPLIAQFCANDPEVFVEACKLAIGHCDAVDLNLGCPQAIARRGHYGAFLQDEWDLLKEIISKVHQEVDIPITCKIRVFEDIQKTIKYAQMLEASGCQILTVHGRTREQKGLLTGIANWDYIKAVKSSVNIPVFANGNIQYLEDVERCLKETSVDGVMIAEGSLHNPALFKGLSPTVWDMGLDYLEFVKKYPCPISYVRGHVFKICHHSLTLEENQGIREKIAKAHSVDEFVTQLCELKHKYEALVNSADYSESISKHGLPYPPWICQPYVRSPPKENNTPDSSPLKSSLFKEEESQSSEKRPINEPSISRKKLRKLQKNPNKQFGTNKFIFEKCTKCLNPRGSKCTFELCKACCRKKAYANTLDCEGHRLYFLTKRKKKDKEAEEAIDSLNTYVLAVNEKCKCENSLL